MNRFGLYLHIPFCQSKCRYCDFTSYAGMDRWQPAVVRRMREELRAWRAQLDARPVTTVYMGGGTPSRLSPGLLDDLLTEAKACFPWPDGAEFTIEMNPGTITGDFVHTALRHGLNRVSLGAQSAQDRLLRSLGRIHTAAGIAEAVRALQGWGLRSLNLDMMIGLPGQTLQDVRDTVAAFSALGPTHISCYSLILEEGTPMYDDVCHGRLTLPDESLERDMYEEARLLLEREGYRQYEISNFAREGFACRHNTDCWQRGEYLGIGPAAAGFIGRQRYRNPPLLSSYLQGHAPEITDLTPEDERFESVMLGLRMNEGLSAAEFERRHGVPLDAVYGGPIARLTAAGLLEWANGSLRCTRRGFDVQNDVLTEFL